MNYDGDIIRPPSEADAIILQVTVGCSHNRCTFCGAYKEKTFRIRSDQEILENIALAKRYQPKARTVFLADGDALIISQKRLTTLFATIHQELPGIRRISLYGNAKAIRSKSPAQLTELKRLGLGRIYMGLESGDDQVLARIGKGETGASMIEAGLRVAEAGIFLSVTVLLGIAGQEESLVHAQKSGQILTAMRPRQIAALTLMPLAGTPLGEDYRQGFFHLPDKLEMLKELRELISHIDGERLQFMANHASNYLPIHGRLPRDKKHMLAGIDQALDGKVSLRPEFTRAL